MTSKDLMGGMKKIKAYYPNWGFDLSNSYAFSVWYEALKAIDVEEFRRIVNEYCTMNEYPPRSPNDLLKSEYAKRKQEIDSQSYNAFRQVVRWLNGRLKTREEWLRSPFDAFDTDKESGKRYRRQVEAEIAKHPTMAKAFEATKLDFYASDRYEIASTAWQAEEFRKWDEAFRNASMDEAKQQVDGMISSPMIEAPRRQEERAMIESPKKGSEEEQKKKKSIAILEELC